MSATSSKPHLSRVFACGFSLAAPFALGQGVVVDLSVKPRLFKSEFVTTDTRQLDEARLDSGLGLSLANPLLAVDVDYSLRSVLREELEAASDGLSQQLNARLSSAVFNDLLGVEAGVRADSVLRGEGYRYKVSPAVSRSLSSLARLSVSYDFVLDRPTPQKAAKEEKAYSMMLDGALGGGRLTWSGRYRSASQFEERVDFIRAVESVDLKSRYLINSSMHLELSSVLRQETRPIGTGEEVFMLRRYGAAFAWAPSREYALGFKLSSLEDELARRNDTVGSGSVSWFPRPDLELTFDYGDQVASGDAGWMLHTRFDIEG